MTNTFKFGAPEGLPRMIRRGENKTLQTTWFQDNTAILVPVVSAFFTLKQGSTVLIDNVAATTIAGPTYSATYDLLAATTAGLSFSDTMLELWTLSTATETVTVRKSGHLVRTILYPLVTDSDLIARHARLEDIRPPSLANFSSYINTACEIINRDLLKRGKRPELVLDSYALIDMHIAKSLELICKDAITFIGDGRYNDLATMYGENYTEEWDVVQFRYDRSEDDDIEEGEKSAAEPSIWLGELTPGGVVWP